MQWGLPMFGGARTISTRNLPAMDNEEIPWIIAVGASGADGLGDIKELLGALPPTLAAIVMVVLHRPWDRPTRLQAILGRASRLPVVIAAQGERFEVGTVYIGGP